MEVGPVGACGVAAIAPHVEMEGIAAVTESETGVEFDFAGDGEARAALLRRLVEAGPPGTEFRPVRRNMQEVYLERLRKDGPGGGEGAA